MVGEDFRCASQRFADRPAVVSCGESLTYRELRDRVFRASQALLALGLRKGDRVGVLSRNCCAHIEILFACAVCGFTFVPLNFRLNVRELVLLVDRSGARVVFLGDGFAGHAESLRQSCPRTETFICLSRQAGSGRDYESLLAAQSARDPKVRVASEDPACIFHTSGSTGRSKEVVWTFGGWRAGSANALWELEFDSTDALLYVVPFFHIAFAWSLLALVRAGARCVILPEFDPDEVLKTIGEQRVTVFMGTPTMINALLRSPELAKRDLSALRTLIYGGSPIPQATLEKALAAFGPILVQIYGQTELSGPATVLSKDDHRVSQSNPGRLRSCGRPMINTEIRLVSESGEPVTRPGEVGEICVRSRALMAGYHGDAEETARALSDGWLRTGDLAYLDDERFVHIVDRKKDIIVSGGENIAPREVEEALCLHPDVAEAAVIGIPDDHWGEAVKALVVPRKGASVTAEDLVSHCKATLAGYKKPRSIEFVETLPRTPLGKIDKGSLRDRYWRDRPRKVH